MPSVQIFFGSQELALALFPKILDSYTVGDLIADVPFDPSEKVRNDRAAIDFLSQICQAGSQFATTQGAGSSFVTHQAGLLGGGVAFDGALVHYGVQPEDPVVHDPRPQPRIIWPSAELSR